MLLFIRMQQRHTQSYPIAYFAKRHWSSAMLMMVATINSYAQLNFSKGMFTTTVNTQATRLPVHAALTMEHKLRRKSKLHLPHTTIAIIFTLAIVLVYSAVVFHLQHDKFWDWLNTLVGSGISFFLAILGGIILYRFQAKAEEKNNRDSQVSLLSAELADLISVLSDSSCLEVELPSKNSRRVLIATVQPLVIEKAAVSGLFTETESENLLHLARKLRMLNFKSQYFMGLISSRSEEQFLVNAIDNIEQTRVASIDGIRLVAKQLGIMLSACKQPEE